MADKIQDRKSTLNLKFDETYVEGVFLLWYSQGRPSFQQLVDQLKPDYLGRTPAIEALGRWRDRYHWVERAELLDIGVTHEIEKQAIKEKVEMLNRHAEAGKLMTDKAVDYLNKHDITKTNDAIKMLVQGVQIERASRGLPLALSKLADLADEQLLNQINELATRMSPDDALKYIGDGVEITEVEEEE